MSNSYISVFVKKMRVQVRIGLLDFEKQAPQPLDVSVEVFADPPYLQQSLRGEALMDYAQLHDHIEAWEDQEHTELLEALLLSLAQAAFTFDAAQVVEISISKAEIFDKAQQAGVAARLSRGDIDGLA